MSDTTVDHDQPSGDQASSAAQQQTTPPPAGDDVAKLQHTLNRERELRKAAEKLARENASFKARVEEIEAANASDLEKAVKAARDEGRREAQTVANGRLIAAEARAIAAAAKFRDPHDATRFLDLGDVEVSEDGRVDTGAIAALLAQLSTDKPYLLADDKPAEQQGPRPPKPDPSQGSGKQTQQTGAERGLAEAARRFGKPATP